MMFLLNAIALDIDTVNKHGAVVGPDRMPWTVTVRQPAIENVLRELKTGYEGAVTFPEGLSMTLKPAVWTTR